MKEEPKSIDEAILASDELIKSRKQSARFALMVVYTVTLIVGFVPLLLFIAPPTPRLSEINIPSAAIYGVLAIYVMFFGVIMSIYRFHIVEGAKAEHAKIGFLRIRIAANNTSSGFQTEVREALTRGAFDYQQSSGLITKKGKIESPLPGHPTTDLTTAVLNKLLDGMEISAKRKK